MVKRRARREQTLGSGGEGGNGDWGVEEEDEEEGRL